MLFSSPAEVDTESTCTFTIRSTLTAHGRAVEQTQYATESYVITEVAGSTVLYAPGLHGRYIVDRARRQLRPVVMTGQAPQPEQIRSLLGQLEIEEESGSTEIDGWACRMIRVHNRDARLIVSVESYCARVPGIGLTALPAERSFDAPFQPFQLPLAADEVVVRSTTRALAADFEQSQTVTLTSLDRRVEGRDALDEMLRFTILRR